MRAICGLFALLIMLGPIGMGFMLTVDSPNLGNDTLYTYNESVSPEDHGTRAAPSEIPTGLNLYYHSGSQMNTTAPGVIDTNIGGLSLTFTLDDPLIKDFKVEDPGSGFPMTVIAYLSGAGTVDITIRDSAGPTVGTATHGPFSLGNFPQMVTINVPFDSGTDYTFGNGNEVVIDFNFGITAGRLHYDSDQAPSRLQLYCTPIPDITVNTYNFYNEPSVRFYPNDIDFPEESPRRQVRMRGIISEVFHKHGIVQYISNVEVVIDGPNTNITRTCDYKKNTHEYSYTWTYFKGQDHGEYTVTTHVFDEQNNEFTVFNSFNMSRYGVLLTSPSQTPEEGTYKSEARKNLVQNSITTYDIKVWNIGYDDTGINITTTGQSGWDWWLWGDDNITSANKTGSIDSITAGDSVGIKFSIDAMSNPLNSKATILVTGTTSEDSLEDNTLTTKSTVVLQYDIELEFADGSSTIDEIVETGDSIVYNFIVFNNGGEDDKIYLDLSSAPAGWSALLSGNDLEDSSSQYWVDLVSGDSTELKLTVETPSDGDEETVDLEITGMSKGSMDQGDDPVSSDKITATTTTTKGIEFIVNDLPEKEVDPNGDIAFEFKVTNTGTTIANFSVSFTGPGSSNGWDIQDISLNPTGFENEKPFNNLAPNNPQTFWLYIEPSENVIAGNNTITVKAENVDKPGRFEQLSVFCIVNEVNKIEIVEPLSLDFNEKADPGDDVEFTIIIENNGNVKERVSIILPDKPKEWDLDFGNASSEWTKDIEPQEKETIKIVLTVPGDAQGDETVDITISIIPVVSEQIPLVAHIEVKQLWYQPLITLLVPLLLFVVIIVMVIVIYKRR